jgi:excisionase family DNA binding protein
MESKRFHDAGSMPVEAKSITPLLVAASDAARLLCVSQRTLWTLAKNGDVRSVKIGRRRLYDPSDLAQFIDRQKTPDQTAIAV